ncbi:hypothetical protein AALO_G00057640 [Alosa alosa]|uniref:Uncharacterized protein n=1 Tax=Alosa alosa TaxID=278164 RepID=A0AAV6H8X2_9TELE|nr:hypothetical protein AALO_G00057640 [Alosa alosa]
MSQCPYSVRQNEADHVLVKHLTSDVCHISSAAVCCRVSSQVGVLMVTAALSHHRRLREAENGPAAAAEGRVWRPEEDEAAAWSWSTACETEASALDAG